MKLMTVVSRLRHVSVLVAVTVVVVGCSTSVMPGGLLTAGAASTSSLANAPRTPPDGGRDYYSQFPRSSQAGWGDPNYFPIGVWLESVTSPDEVRLDREAGLNTYFRLTNDSNPDLAIDGGMHVVADPTKLDGFRQASGWFLADEIDMTAGPGDGPWNGDPDSPGQQCPTSEIRCGYTAMQNLSDRAPRDGRVRWANYGKGVMLWQTFDQGQKFVNRYTDIVSNDIYWYTDPSVCISAQSAGLPMPASGCRSASNYGLMVDRMRQMDAADGKRQPVLNFVEVGAPSDNGVSIEPAQIQGAVISSVIHGARGIIYFNHSFSGPCVSAHVLRDACTTDGRRAVGDVNRQLQELAPALNSDSIDVDLGPDVDATLRQVGVDYYLIAMRSGTSTTSARRILIPAELSDYAVTKPYEGGGAVDYSGDTIAEDFPYEYSYHIYRLSPK